ncbi:MAG: FAD-dependent catabolic D-arginine dehydrogenase DauA [Steroidobacteraceae bacterium]
MLVIGGGIAGASAAYEIAASSSVLLLEREAQCGYHSTGRSAASFTENYGNGVVRRLAIASRRFLETPPSGFCDHSLLLPRGLLTIARSDQLDLLAAQFKIATSLVPSIVAIEAAAALEHVPILRPDYVAAAFYEPDSMDLDVNGLHLGYLRGARARGVRVVVNCDVLAVDYRDAVWSVTTAQGSFEAPIVVNAAGAWADTIAGLAGLPPLGLVPKRRTAFNLPLPTGAASRGWPMVDDVGDELYFKPDAGQLLVSPSDATPSDPVDAQPEDLDVAVAVERFERMTRLPVMRVSRSWAGLRTYAPDGSPVVGWDGVGRGFFWLAGQGGFGIKTSPALSRACAAMIHGGDLPAELQQLSLTAEQLSPRRLADA